MERIRKWFSHKYFYIKDKRLYASDGFFTYILSPETLDRIYKPMQICNRIALFFDLIMIIGLPIASFCILYPCAPSVRDWILVSTFATILAYMIWYLVKILILMTPLEKYLDNKTSKLEKHNSETRDW